MQLAYLEWFLSGDRDEVLSVCATRPITLGLSLEKRIKPRCEMLLSGSGSALNVDHSDIGASADPSCCIGYKELFTALAQSAPRYQKWLERHFDREMERKV